MISYCLFALESAIEKEGFKSKITDCQEQIQIAPLDQLGQLKVKLAILHYQDQNLDHAFIEYLEALDITEKQLASNLSAALSKKEKEYYEDALKLYLGHSSGQAKETSQKILEEYQAISNENQHFHHLNYLICAALANLGRFDQFFEKFYLSFLHDPHSYMAYRTKAVLHIKLFEKARTEVEKEKQREAIFVNIQKASRLNPEDSSAYKLMIVFSKEEEKAEIVKISLQKIVSESILIPRADLLFYVNAAVTTKQRDLARKFIDKAKEWYKQSRLVDHAEELLAQEL